MMNVQLREEKLFKARLASVIVSCNNFFSYWFIVPPVKPLLVYFFCFSVPEVWILFTSNPLTLLRASSFGCLTQLHASFGRMFFPREVVTVNKFMPLSSKITSYGEAAAASTKRGFSVTYFSGLVKAFGRAKIKSVSDSGRVDCKLFATSSAKDFDSNLPSFVLTSWGTV